jgi:hypothetical protein
VKCHKISQLADGGRTTIGQLCHFRQDYVTGRRVIVAAHDEDQVDVLTKL